MFKVFLLCLIAGIIVPVFVLGASSSPISVPMLIRVSRYWPPLGGTNCADFVDGECLSNLADGGDWSVWEGRAAACPPEWPFGTTVTIEGKDWLCKGRGGSVQYVNGIPWVDLLQKRASYKYGTIIPAIVLFPDQRNNSGQPNSSCYLRVVSPSVRKAGRKIFCR